MHKVGPKCALCVIKQCFMNVARYIKFLICAQYLSMWILKTVNKPRQGNFNLGLVNTLISFLKLSPCLLYSVSVPVNTSNCITSKPYNVWVDEQILCISVHTLYSYIHSWQHCQCQHWLTIRPQLISLLLQQI